MPSDIFAEIDTSELLEAMKLYASATGKDGAEIANRAAINSVIGGRGQKGAMHFAPKVSAAKLNKYEPKPGRKRWKEHHTLFHALASEGNKFGKASRGQGNRAVAQKTWKSRKRAFGYARAVWMAVARELGARLRGKFDIPAARGVRATPITLTARFDTGNLADSRSFKNAADFEKDMLRALQAGVNAAAQDMAEYAARKMQETADGFSAK